MNRMSIQFLYVVLLFLFACRQEQEKKDYIITEKDLIPEGAAFDNRTGTIYISSTFKRKIIQITKDGKISDFIPEQSNGVTSILGMEVDEDRGVLWVNMDHANEVLPLKNPHPTQDWMSGMCSFDIQNKKQIKQYHLHDEKSFLNDLTVLPDGDVFATETVNSKIYRTNARMDSLELFLAPKGITFLNGITYSEKWNCLFVSGEEGVLRVDMNNRNYFLIGTPEGTDAKRIDGLSLYKGRLIGHQSNKVVAFYLNEQGTEIVKSGILDSGKEFDSSTTGEIGRDEYYFIVNSQVRSGIDPVSKTLKPADSLEEVIIRRIRL